MGLTSEQREQLLPSGSPRHENRCGWAITYLTRAGALDRPQRGNYAITELGRVMLAKHPDGLTEQILKEYVPNWDELWQTGDVSSQSEVIGESSTLDPVEQIEQGSKRIQQSVAADLLDRIQQREPVFFENAVLKLLDAMGYSGVNGRVRATSLTNDGGIDGVIDQDALGLNKVYVQAKRYARGNSVQRPEVQAFVGALSGKANGGVFITTSTFSDGAKEYARAAHSEVILVDGARLAELMIEYGVGVQEEKNIKIVRVDEDFFA